MRVVLTERYTHIEYDARTHNTSSEELEFNIVDAVIYNDDDARYFFNYLVEKYKFDRNEFEKVDIDNAEYDIVGSRTAVEEDSKRRKNTRYSISLKGNCY